ncbi:alpha/beta hydrolase [Echinicola jeungdonensis]|uniref:Alpha/beta hydrolase n=1 Tax=Echinicola jeungdonensis TaxID=709343 RepID=A0ABV5J8E4_9BACT|nr:alpha/beta hydrolase [Echinicola jeungdonensis]MDN3669453.1 alpha/beta hydrolase [Echinicola jeungdonensis]
MNTRGIFLLSLLISISFLSYSQRKTVPLYKGEAPLTKKMLPKDVMGHGGRVDRVSIPELTIYRAEDEKSNGMAIMICPGGGYQILAIEHEGHEIAQWYQQRGYTAVVLKYRLPEKELLEKPWEVPLMDAKAGLKYIRENAENWNIDPEKVGVLGFSAGGHLASSVSVHGEPGAGKKISTQPNFSILIYPVVSMDTSVTHQGSRKSLLGDKLNTQWETYFSNEMQVGPETPPAFLVHSWDDTAVLPDNSIRYAKALNQMGVKTELHLYEKGGHGYGKGDKDKTGNAYQWLDLSHKWIQGLF